MLGVLLGILTQVNLRQWKWPLMLLAVFTLVPFAHTLSRASYGAIVVMYLTLIFFSKFSTKTVLMALLALFLIFFMVFKPDFVMHRLVSAVTPEYQENIPTVKIGGLSLGASPSARILDWIDLFQTWKTKPFLGFGLTGVRFVDGQYIKVLVETGVLGLLPFIMLLFVIFHQVHKIYKKTKNPLYKGLAMGFLVGHAGQHACPCFFDQYIHHYPHHGTVLVLGRYGHGHTIFRAGANTKGRCSKHRRAKRVCA